MIVYHYQNPQNQTISIIILSIFVGNFGYLILLAINVVIIIFIYIFAQFRIHIVIISSLLLFSVVNQ